MRSTVLAVTLLAVLVAGVGWSVSRLRAADGPLPGDAPPTQPPSTRQDLELTVYTQDFGLVREVRPMRLASGPNRLRLLEVSKRLDPHSVLLRWRGAGAHPPQLVAHAYDLGVASSDGLLQRYVGRPIEVVRYGENGHEAERQTGTLMVEANGEVVVQADGKLYVHPRGTIVAPANGDVVTIPQLSVQAESPAAQAAPLELAYLTRGLSWSADYVATLSPQDSALTFECWATVTNRTGVDYPNAKVSLIAGNPNRAANAVTPASLPARFASLDGHEGVWGGDWYKTRARLVPAPPEVVGDFHAYTIRKPTTVVQEQMNRLLLLAAARVPVLKDYSARLPALSAWAGDDWGTSGQPRRDNVQLALTLTNREQAGLGVPLPQGDLRLYEPDRSGSLRYSGAASIPNTPRNQKVRLTLSRAFDLFTEARITKVARVRRHTVRKEVELVLHNEKTNSIGLRVVQPFDGRWKIVRASHPYANLDAGSTQWRVEVPAAGTVTIRYAVELSG
jgi:hypothetical protein